MIKYYILIGISVGVIISGMLYWAIENNYFTIMKERIYLYFQLRKEIRDTKKDKRMAWVKGKFTSTQDLLSMATSIIDKTDMNVDMAIKIFVSEKLYKYLIKEQPMGLSIMTFAIKGFWIFEDNHILGMRYKIAYVKKKN